MVQVKDLMKRDLVSVGWGAPVGEAARLMKERRVGSIFVKQGDRLVGIVTEPDIIRKVIGNGHCSPHIPVEEIMSSPILGIDEHRPLTEAADLMDHHHTRHLAVTNGGSIVGVISVRDLLHPVSIDEF